MYNAILDPGRAEAMSAIQSPTQRSRCEDQSPNLPLVNRVNRLAEPRDGLWVLRREVIRILDEREMLDSSQDFRRQLPIDVPHAEVEVQRAVSHSECLDKGPEDDAPVELEGFQPVAAVDLLRNERTEQLQPVGEASTAFEEPANERLRIERRNAYGVPLLNRNTASPWI